MLFTLSIYCFVTLQNIKRHKDLHDIIKVSLSYT